VSRRVVVTGIGVVTPLAIGVAEFWRRALAGESVCEPLPAHWSAYYRPHSTVWAPLPLRDFAAQGISRIEAAQLDRSEQIAVVCAREALEAAGLVARVRDAKKGTFTLEGVDPAAAGVFMGTGIGGGTSLLTNLANHIATPLLAGFPAQSAALGSLLRAPPRFNPFAVTMTMPNGPGAVVGIRFGLQGRTTTCAAACASGGVAIGHALRAVRSGEMHLALAGGVEYLADEHGGFFRAFDVVRTLACVDGDPTRANRPFDAGRSGFLFAEGGGAVLVVEELDHALRRGAPVIAELAGYGETFDAHSVMMIEPSGSQMERMIALALADAGVAPGEVDYVNAHGTGTLLNDETEVALLGRVFGDRPLVNSTKSLIGHTIGASGAIEAAVAALSIRDQATHPSANLERPIGALRYVRKPGPASIGCALSESFAFGGHNAALVLKRCST
jgi:3-oxoacyl-[acyl-carrier-protein] synthase II